MPRLPVTSPERPIKPSSKIQPLTAEHHIGTLSPTLPCRAGMRGFYSPFSGSGSLNGPVTALTSPSSVLLAEFEPLTMAISAWVFNEDYLASVYLFVSESPLRPLYMTQTVYGLCHTYHSLNRLRTFVCQLI